MSYAIIKNMPLNNGFFSRTSADKIDWVKYGFTIDGLRNAKQGKNSDGDYLNIFPISDEDKFNTYLEALQTSCSDSSCENDSIEMVTDEEAEALIETLVVASDEEDSA